MDIHSTVSGDWIWINVPYSVHRLLMKASVKDFVWSVPHSCVISCKNRFIFVLLVCSFAFVSPCYFS